MTTDTDLTSVGYESLSNMHQKCIITADQFEAALIAMAIDDAESNRSEIKPEHLTNDGGDYWGDDDCCIADLAAEQHFLLDGSSPLPDGERHWELYLDAFETHCKQMLLATV